MPTGDHHVERNDSELARQHHGSDHKDNQPSATLEVELGKCKPGQSREEHLGNCHAESNDGGVQESDIEVDHFVDIGDNGEEAWPW